LTIAAATALSRAIRSQTHLNPEIKWPNDILLGGMKVVGILTELSTELDRIHHAVVGVGVNVNQVSQDFPPSLAGLATSLRLASGQMVNRADLAAAILLELEADYRRICHGHFMAVAEEWLRQCVTLGQQVCLQVGGRRLLGRAEALDADGALLLRTQHGHLERVVGGDVTIEKPQRRPEF
jgi:BirA family biotin operon repressor/biotin-[acetyl-CoA-carboxylase] ligase